MHTPTATGSENDRLLLALLTAAPDWAWASEAMLRAIVGTLERAAERPLDSGYRLNVRIGINAGEPIDEDRDRFGTSVIVAARTAASAGGGQTVVTDVVRRLAAGKAFLFADRGPSTLKGFEAPVRTWEVLW